MQHKLLVVPVELASAGAVPTKTIAASSIITLIDDEPQNLNLDCMRTAVAVVVVLSNSFRVHHIE